MRAGALRRIVGWWGTLLVGVAGAGAGLHSDQARAARPELVTLEFRALQNGLPIFDLQLDEVVLRVDDTAQQVRALELVRLDASGTPPPFATNDGARRGRDVILAIDEESFQSGSELPLRDALTNLLRHLTPRDRVGLVSLHASGTTAALTVRHAEVEAAISKLRGRAIGAESPTDLACRTRRLLPVLSNLMQGLDARTTVLLFSTALAAPAAAAAPSRGAESGCLLLPTDFDEFRAAATRSAAAFYALQLPAAPGRTQDGSGLERLAGESGGRFAQLPGDPAAEMTRIANETGGFYIASIALDPPARGTARKSVDLRIRRAGVTARVRAGLSVPAPDATKVSARDMIRVSTAYRALPLRAAAFPSRDRDDTAKLVVLFEPAEPSVSLTSAMVGAFNARGQLISQWIGEREDLAGRPVMAGLVVPHGTYRIRVAAVDASGRSGSVDDELRVELPSAAFATTSAVVAGAAMATGFMPRLQFTGAVYLEVYGLSTCAALSGRLDIAASQQGPPLAKSTATATPIEQTGGCILFGQFDLAALPPGDYVIRLELVFNGEVIGRRNRTLRKSG